MSKSRLGFGVFVWLLTCVNHSVVWAVKTFLLVCISGLHVLAHTLKQWGSCNPLSTTSDSRPALAVVQRCGVPYPCPMLAVVSQGENNALQMPPWVKVCEPNNVWSQTPGWEKLQWPPGFGADGSMPCSSSLCLFPLLPIFASCEIVLGFTRLPEIAVILTTLRSLSCSWQPGLAFWPIYLWIIVTFLRLSRLGDRGRLPVYRRCPKEKHRAPQEKDKLITASLTRLLTKYGLHCPNNELQFNHVRCPFLRRKAKHFPWVRGVPGRRGARPSLRLVQHLARGPGP